MAFPKEIKPIHKCQYCGEVFRNIYNLKKHKIKCKK